MRNLKTIYRPTWTLQKARKLNKLWLDKNENTHPKLLKLYENILKNVNPIHVSTYPELGSLYKKISSYENLSTKNIIFSHGSDGCIKNIFETFTKKNQKVLTLSPTFVMYDIYPKIFKLNHVKFDYNFSKTGPIVNIENLIKKIKSERPRLLCIANPNSPTGTIIEDIYIHKLIKVCKSINCFVLIDEAYYGFYKKTAKKFIKQYNNIFIIRSLSKAWGLAGLRLGYIISNKKNIELINRIRPMYEINTFGAEFLKLLLDKKYFVKLELILKEMIIAKNLFYKFLRKNKINFFLSYANFVHFEIKENRKKIIHDLSKLSYFRLSENHKSLDNYSRLTLTSKNNIKKIMKILKKK